MSTETYCDLERIVVESTKQKLQQSGIEIFPYLFTFRTCFQTLQHSCLIHNTQKVLDS